METAEIRRRWLRYFSTRGHTVIAGAPLIPARPSEQLFVSSAMVPFTPFLFGEEPAPFPRATSVQKCVRVQDIPQVGQTSRHSTFFQMNGSFSFGEYDPSDAIELAWELITRHQSDGGYGLDESRLWVTVLHDDDETIRAWEQVAGLPGERIVRRGPNENYWHAGLPGPGGPRSAVFADRGRDYGPDGGPDADEDRYLQFWNLTFLRDHVAAIRGMGNVGVDAPLAVRTIGSQMGLERMACLLQGVDNVYEIDEVFAVIARIEELSGRRYGLRPDDDTRMRVIADHVRAALMLLAEGVTPDAGDATNAVTDGALDVARGAVAGQLLDDTVRALTELGVQEPSLVDLLSVSRDRMDAAYPELDDDFSRIAKLAATHEHAVGTEPAAAIDAVPGAGPGEQDASEFTGFRELSTDAAVLTLMVDGATVPAAEQGQIVQVVLGRTPFYAQAGGQAADQGEITGDGTRLRVLDVQTVGEGVIVHTAEVVEGTIRTGHAVRAGVDREWRLGACQAHSATHVVLAAIRQVLGPDAVRCRSANRPGQLRLDIAWPAALGPATLVEVESVANLALRSDYPVTATYLPLAQARELGALGSGDDGDDGDDGEPADREPGHGDQLVRVVEMGGAWSRELCGGTHVEHSSQIGAITITGETAAAPGVRRIDALVGLEALHHLNRGRALVNELSDVLEVGPHQLVQRVSALVARVRDGEREREQLRRASLLAGAQDLAQAPADVFGVSVVTHDAGEAGADDARALAIDVRERMPADRPGVVAVSVLVAQKPFLIVTTNGEARQWGVRAGDLVREATTVLGGSLDLSDVQPADIAQSDGTDPDKVKEAFRRIEYSVGERVTSRG